MTGAGRGIGREEALLLAAEGAAVTVNDVDATAAEAVVEEIVGAGGTARVDHHDVSSWGGAEAAVGGVVAAGGKLDILANNAGVLRDTMSFSMTEAQWDDVIGVHLKGHAACAHFAGAHWRERSKSGEAVSGRLVNTASESGLYGLVGQVNYATAKAGIAAMTIVLARELQKYGVTVNAIAPGYIDTDMVAAVPAPVLEKIVAKIPVGRLGQAEEIARGVAFLCSENAGFVTGSTMSINGGQHMY